MPHRILVPLSCHAAARMRGREPCRSASLAGQAVGNCARRIDEGSLWNPPASGGVCGASGWSRTSAWCGMHYLLSRAFKES